MVSNSREKEKLEDKNVVIINFAVEIQAC